MADKPAVWPQPDTHEAEYLRSIGHPLYTAYSERRARYQSLLNFLRATWYLLDRVCFGIGAGWLVSRFFLWRYGLI